MAERTSASFEVEAKPELETRVESLRYTERLGAPYEAVVTVSLPSVDVDALGLLGERALLRLDKGSLETRRVPGLVWGVSSPSAPTGDGRVDVEVTLVPALRLLELNLETRIFQDKTVPEILEDVLGAGLSPLGCSVSSELQGEYRPREYCVQYRESTLAFAQRLMEEEGIFYSFDFSGRDERLVLHDANASLTEVAPGSIFELRTTGRVTLERSLSRFERRHAVATNAVALSDWDWTGPRVVSADESASETPIPAHESYEHGRARTLSIADYDEGVLRYQSDDGAAQAERRLQAHGVDAELGAGESAVPELRAGGKLTVGSHPMPGFDGEYVVTEVEHVFAAEGEGGGEDHDGYRNRFLCIPSSAPFRLARATPKPTIGSVQTATVVGPAGEEIHTDAYGRVKVQFHWDRLGAGDETSSCWLRVRQPWAGDGWGFVFLPRVGMEAIVSFLHGDPDRPLVTGTVYNANNRAPYPLPDEKTKSTIKTNSSPGGGGFNEVRFEDSAGSEQIYIHAQKDFNERIEACHTTTVGGNQTNEVKGDQTQEIGDWQDEAIDIDQEMVVEGHRKVKVGGAFDEYIDTGEDRNVTGGSTEDIESGELRLISGPSEEVVEGGEKRTVEGGQLELILGSATRNVTGPAQYKASGAFTKTVTGALTVTTPGAINVTASSGYILDAAGPVTASGGPLVEVIASTRTEVYKIKLEYGLMKFGLYGAVSSDVNVKVGVGGVSVAAAELKLEDYGLKVDVGGRKGGTTGTKVDNTIFELGANGKKAWLGGFMMM